MAKPKISFYNGDLPDNVISSFKEIAVDTETMGLNVNRDRLCLIQISSGNNDAYIVKFDKNYNCPNIKKILKDEKILKIFHFARFDVAMIIKNLNVEVNNIYCTKIASKLCRTNTDKHGLKELCKILLGVELVKEQQTSDWGADNFSIEQMTYAANDVLYLHQLKKILDDLLVREGRKEIAYNCFSFLNNLAKLDILQFEDIFAHS